MFDFQKSGFFVVPPACPLKPSKLRVVKLRGFPYGSIFANLTSHSRPPARADDSSFEADSPMAHADTQLVLEQRCSHRTNDSEQTPLTLPSPTVSFSHSSPHSETFLLLLKLIFSLNCKSQNGSFAGSLLSA